MTHPEQSVLLHCRKVLLLLILYTCVAVAVAVMDLVHAVMSLMTTVTMHDPPRAECAAALLASTYVGLLSFVAVVL